MRILYLIQSTGHGGAETALLKLLQGMLAAGASPVLGVIEEGWLPESARATGAEVVLLDSRSSYTGWDFTAALRLSKLIRTSGAQIVHCVFLHMNMFGTLAAGIAKRPVIASLRSINYDFATWYRRAAWRLISRRATATVAVSAQAASLLRSTVNAPAGRLHVIPNGVDTALFRPGPRRGLLSSLGLPPDAVVVGTVGRASALKGHGYLLEAAASVAKADRRCHFVIAGEYPPAEEQGMLRRADALGLGGRFHLIGAREDVPDLLREFDVFALPSLSEGMSNALIEAQATGLPAVATSVGGNPEVVVHGETGLIVPPEDAESLASAMLRLLGDKDLLTRMGRAARDRACRVFPISAMVDRHRALYSRIMEQARMPRG